MRTLFILMLVGGVAINCAPAAVIPVSGSFDPSWGDSRSFEGTITIDDRHTGSVYLAIGNQEVGLTQEFHMPLTNTSRVGTQDVAILQNRLEVGGEEVCGWYGCFPPVAGAFIDIDAARGLYDAGGVADDDFRILKISMYVYDTGDDFSGYWVFHRNAAAVPEPSGWFLLVMGGAFLVRRKHR